MSLVWLWLGACGGSDANVNAAGAGGSAGAGASAGTSAGASAGTGGSGDLAAERFSFFLTSYTALHQLSGNPNGFGGDLRYGEADGLSGADKICREIAELSAPGAGKREWHAFLSVTRGADGRPVHAIDRIGKGPWYDRLGRLVAADVSSLLDTRPIGADPAIIDDLPNELGVPNHAPTGTMPYDNHDVLTGTGVDGHLYKPDWSCTCHDWTSSQPMDGRPRVGHSWPRSGTPEPGSTQHFPIAGSFGMPPHENETEQTAQPDDSTEGLDNWMSALDEAGCAPGASLFEQGPPRLDNPTVGSGGGYGGFYCFAVR
jgi:hypothetical protein